MDFDENGEQNQQSPKFNLRKLDSRMKFRTDNMVSDFRRTIEDADMEEVASLLINLPEPSDAAKLQG